MTQLQNFYVFLNNLDKDILIDLLSYLKKQKYDAEIIMLFLDSFKSIYDHNDEHKAIEPTLEDPDDYAKQYIRILKYIGKADFVRDINGSNAFLKKMEEANKNIILGYIKDQNGNYVLSEKPTHICTMAGFSNCLNGFVSILFDEVTKRDYEYVINAIFHELSHIKYGGYLIPKYIMNYSYFYRFLDEGHVTKTSRRVSNETDYLNRPPCTLYKRRGEKIETYNIYSIYQYLYFKFEFLFGSYFMKEFCTTKNEEDFLSNARRKINEMYGEGTFIKLYKNVQLILCSLSDFSDKKLKETIKKRNNQLQLCKKNSALTKEDIIAKQRGLYRQLYDITYFRESYDEYCKSSSGDINILTELEYRIKVTEEIDVCDEQLLILKDKDLFKDIATTEIEVCKSIMRNPYYSMDAASNLESLMTSCMMRDLTKGYNVDYLAKRLALYNHYVVDWTFELPSLKKAKLKLKLISSYVNTFKMLDGKIVKVKKQ